MIENISLFIWLKNKIRQELFELLTMFAISALILSSAYLLEELALPKNSKIPSSAWSISATMSAIVALIGVAATFGTTIVTRRRLLKLKKATKRKIETNEGSYSLEETASSPLTIYIRNSSSFSSDSITAEIHKIVPYVKLLGTNETSDSKSISLTDEKDFDIFMLVLDKAHASLIDKDDYRQALSHNKSTLVLLRKDEWDGEELLESSLGALPTKISFFSSFDELLENISLLLSDTLISGYRQSRKMISKEVISPIKKDILEASTM